VYVGCLSVVINDDDDDDDDDDSERELLRSAPGSYPNSLK